MSEIEVIWSEDLELPICEYCSLGRTCVCEAADADPCDYCEMGCDCGYEQVLDGEVCDCECTCENDDDGNCEDCCVCGYPLKDELPDMCYCECTCPTCECYCECPVLVIDADSYNDWVKQTCYICDPACLDDKFLQVPEPVKPSFVESNRRCIIDLGPYQFFIRTLPHYVMITAPIGPTFMGMPLFGGKLKYETYKEKTSLPVIQDGYKGMIRFTGPVHIPVLAQSLYEDKFKVWMSLTPMEVMSQRPGVELATGNVLVGGLGMGWLTRRILEKETVKHVTQIELNDYIIDFFGKPLEEMYSDKLDIIKADVWDYLDDVDINQFDAIILDIWPAYSDARWDRKFSKLRKAHPRVWGWGQEGIKNSES